MYTGPNVTLGYAQSRFDLSRPDENHGILHTGDMAKRDIDGFYYIVGRKKRFLKLFGSRVNLDEVERMLTARFPEAELACVGRDDLLAVFYASGGRALPEDLLERIRGTMDELRRIE